MSGLLALRRRIRGVRALDEVVHAMRLIAGVRLRQTQRAFAGLAAYEHSVAGALGMALAFWPEAGRQLAARAAAGAQALVLVGSEHGFAGAYNQRLAEDARLRLAPGDRLLVVGARAARLARRLGLEPALSLPMPVRAAQLPATALAVAEALWPPYQDGTVARLAALHSRAPHGDAPVPTLTTLAPAPAAGPAARPAQPPLTNLPPRELVGRLAGELLVARLNLALAEAMQAENLLRLHAMERARRNIGRRLDELRLGERRLAQELTTSEILELAGGAG